MRCCDRDLRCIEKRRKFLYQSGVAMAGWIGLSRLGCGSMTAHRITVMRWHADSQKLVAATEGCLQIIDPDTGQEASRISIELQKILDLAFDPRGQHVLIAGGDPSQRGIVELRQWHSGDRHSGDRHSGDRHSSDWPSGDLLQSHVIEGDVVTRVAWSPEGERWLEVDWNGGCRIRGVSGTPPIQYAGHTRTILAAAWAKSQPWVATAGVESSIHIWNPDDGAPIRRFDQHTQSVVALDFIQPDMNPDPFLVSAGEDATLRLWQPKNGRLIRFARLPATPISIASLGSGLVYAVVLDDGRIIRVDLADLSMIPLIESASEDRIQAVATNGPGDMLYVMRESGLRSKHLRPHE
jgi:WD40 repeat protein